MVQIKVYDSNSPIVLQFTGDTLWGQFVESYLKSGNNSECILKYNNKFIGIDIPLSDIIHNDETDNALEVISLSSQFSSEPHYYRIKYAYNAYSKKLSWPLWKQGDICPINSNLLGCWNKQLKFETVPLIRDNRPENLIILSYKNNVKKIVNKFAYYASVLMNNNIDPFTEKEIDSSVLDIIGSDTYKDFNELLIIDMRPDTPTSFDKSYSCEDMQTLVNSKSV